MNEQITTDESKANIVRMVNGINILPTPLLVSQLTLGIPQPVVESDATGKNTVIQLDAVPGVLNTQHDSWSGSVPAFYNRIDLGVLLQGVTVVWLTSHVESTQDFALWAKDNLGINLYPEDLIHVPLDLDRDDGLFITITVADSSVGWTGETKVLLKKPTIELTDVIAPGTRLPIYVAPEKVSSFKAYSYNFDWSAYQALLRNVANEAGNGPYHRTLAGILLGDTGRDVFVDHPTFIKYTGADIVANGGRSGNVELFVNRDLDIWLHVGE